MQRRLIMLLAIAALAVGLAACGSSKSSASAKTSGGSAQITIGSDFTFSAATVAAGATVTVKNDSSAQHTVTADTGNAFNVNVDPGKTVTFTAPSKAGSYKFHCNIHSFMHGTLTVT